MTPDAASFAVPVSPAEAPAGAPLPRSIVSIGLAPELRGRLSAMARGRTLVLDFFASRCCGTSVAVGDLVARFVAEADPRDVALAPVEGVPLAADPRLIELLRSAGPTLRLGGPTFARHLAVGLDDPVAWLDFLATPAALRRR